MRKTIDEIKSELSNTSIKASFRMLTRKEQSDIIGKAHIAYNKRLPKNKAHLSPPPKHLRSFFDYLTGK